jgi:hypothetical protein
MRIKKQQGNTYLVWDNWRYINLENLPPENIFDLELKLSKKKIDQNIDTFIEKNFEVVDIQPSNFVKDLISEAFTTTYPKTKDGHQSVNFSDYKFKYDKIKNFVADGLEEFYTQNIITKLNTEILKEVVMKKDYITSPYKSNITDEVYYNYISIWQDWDKNIYAVYLYDQNNICIDIKYLKRKEFSIATIKNELERLSKRNDICLIEKQNTDFTSFVEKIIRSSQVNIKEDYQEALIWILWSVHNTLSESFNEDYNDRYATIEDIIKEAITIKKLTYKILTTHKTLYVWFNELPKFLKDKFYFLTNIAM